MHLDKKQWARLGVSCLCVIVSVLFLSGIVHGGDLTYQTPAPVEPVPEVPADILAAISVSMGANEENSYVTDYLE